MTRLTAALLLASATVAQQPQQQPTPAQLHDQFSSAANLLRNDQPATIRLQSRKKLPKIQGTITKDDSTAARQELLPATAQQVLDLVRHWSEHKATPTIDNDGRVLFAYGEGLPIIPCAVLKATEVDLEPGEEIQPEAVDIGDGRFYVTPRKTGVDGKAMPYLVLKPKVADLDTTLVVGTNRRPYYMRLVSTQSDYVKRVAFTYPEDERKRRLAEMDAERNRAIEAKKQADILVRQDTEGPPKNTDYETKLKGKEAAYLKPISVWDDGVHTYIKFQQNPKTRGIPSLQIRDAKGAISPNVNWEETRLVVHALFEQACLVAGVGKHQQSACIVNHGYKPGAAHAN